MLPTYCITELQKKCVELLKFPVSDKISQETTDIQITNEDLAV